MTIKAVFSNVPRAPSQKALFFPRPEATICHKGHHKIVSRRINCEPTTPMESGLCGCHLFIGVERRVIDLGEPEHSEKRFTTEMA